LELELVVVLVFGAALVVLVFGATVFDEVVDEVVGLLVGAGNLPDVVDGLEVVGGKPGCTGVEEVAGSGSVGVSVGHEVGRTCSCRYAVVGRYWFTGNTLALRPPPQARQQNKTTPATGITASSFFIFFIFKQSLRIR